MQSQKDTEQQASNTIGSDDGNNPGSPGSAAPGAKTMNKPSEVNQGHSMKAEAIEVRLNTEFYAGAVDDQQPTQQQMDKQQQQQNLSPERQDEQMQGQAPGDPNFQHQYTINSALVRMGINERLSLPDHDQDYDQFGGGGAYHHAGHHGVLQHTLSGDQGVEDVDSPGGFGGNGQGNNAGSAMFNDGVGGPGQVDQDMSGAGVLNAADTGQNDRRFYTLAELAEMEPMFERQFYSDVNSTNQHNAHVLLSPQEYRAKLYWLDPENRWKDIGTGRFRLLLSKDQEEHYIQVVSEDCMDDQIAMENDIGIDKVVGGIVQNQGDNTQSPQGVNGQGHQLPSNPSRQEFLHRCFVFCLQEFSRQGDTIITWQDDYKNEFALSFQDEKGAQNTWWSICFLKGIQINSNIDEPNEAGGSSETNSITGNGVVLPTKENLAELVNDLFSPDAYTRRNIAEAVLKQEESISRGNHNGNSSELSERDHSKLQSWRSQYLDKLQKIFNEVEQQFKKASKAMEENEGDEHDRYIHMQQQVNHLHSLFQIFRNLLNLNQSELLEVLLNENYWRTTFGALEYDPEVFSPLGSKYDNQGSGARSPVGQKPSGSASLVSSPNSNARSYGNYDHFEQGNQYSSCMAQEADFRDFLETKVKYKQAVAIEDPQVIYSIHLSYKLQYLKDTAMARFIDENTSHTIMQLVSQLHQIILDYIFGDDFERIQNELIGKMRDNSNVQDKENALKFFLEICALLKSINLTNRQLQTCNQAFLKIMQVLAQIFDIMLPDRSTLLAEVKQDKEGLVRIFEARSIKDLEKVASAASVAAERTTQIATATVTDPLQQAAIPDTKEEVVNQGDNPDYNWMMPKASEPGTPSEGEEKAFDEALQGLNNNTGSDIQDCIINPGRATVEEYLKNPLHSEDPSMTQIDILKSNSIEIFYNLLILLNNVNHSTIREFLCSDHQKKNNYVFLRHLAQHMMYTSQQGIKVSICEFFKDLTSKETSEMQKNFQQIILFQVVSQFVEFLSEDESLENIEEAERKKQLAAKTGEVVPDTQMKDEEQKSQDSRQTVDPKVLNAYRKQIDQSRILILQFLNKLIVDNVDSYQLRMFFYNNQILIKVVECHQYNSIQTNVEIIKFFKAIIQAKDTKQIQFMINKQIFDRILEIFLNNKTKGNLLHSCILNLFEMLTPPEMSSNAAGSMPNLSSMGLDNGYGSAPKMEGGYVQPQLLNKLYRNLNENGYVKRIFLNKQYEEGFRKFNRSLKQALDIHMSEQDSKRNSDRNVSESPSQPRFSEPSSRVKKPDTLNMAGKTEEDQLIENCFPGESIDDDVNHQQLRYPDQPYIHDDNDNDDLKPVRDTDNNQGMQDDAQPVDYEAVGEERKSAEQQDNREAQMSPILDKQADDQELQIGEALAAPDKSPTALQKARSGLQSSPDLEISPEASSGRRRRNSQDQFEAGRNVIRQSSNNSSNKMHNLSDDGNGSNKAHGGGKSAFSDTISNPDLDEFIFNKGGASQPIAPTGFAFSINSPAQPIQGNALKLKRQHSPIEGFVGISKDDNSPSIYKAKPLIKVGSYGHSIPKKPHAHRNERRRGRSEQGPDRNDIGLATSFNNEDKLAGHEELRKLDEKLDTSTAEVPVKPNLVAMRRGESICESFAAIDGVLAGQKRTRNDEAGQDNQEDDLDAETAALLKESWINKRPKLDTNNQQEEQQHLASAVQNTDQAMINDDEEDEAVKQLLSASIHREPKNQ